MTVHKHNPETGGHLCGERVHRDFKVTEEWTRCNKVKRIADGKSEGYIGGEWCCGNDWKLVTCKKCLRLKDL